MNKKSFKVNYKKIVFVVTAFILILSFFYIKLFRSDIVYGAKEQLKAKENISLIAKSFEGNIKNIDLGSDDIEINNNLILVNNKNSINNLKIKENLVEYKDTGLLVDKHIVDSLDELIYYGKQETDENLFIMSSFRDPIEQKNLYLNDKRHAQKPNHSEHETGLALDFYTDFLAGRNILKSDIGKFLYTDSYKYGFILRYPLFKKHITGISYEPWHLRYTGSPHSEIIYKTNSTLEEYIEKLKQKDYFLFNNYYISYQEEKDGKIKVPSTYENISVSPDNTGGYIITARVNKN
ncbi:MAG: M15 family metallopeptidase [Clostridium sp.]|nr:M15 family metallopeptidase [Clostridium sp.]